MRMYPDEAQRIVAALGGKRATIELFALSEPTVRRILADGCAGATCAALRLAFRCRLYAGFLDLAPLSDEERDAILPRAA